MKLSADPTEGAPPVRRLRSDAKLRPNVQAAICKLVESGLTIRRAAELLKIHHSTIAEFRERHPEFSEALLAAEGRFVQHQIDNIQTAANKGNWQASAWLLERRFATEYSQPQIQIQNNLNLRPTSEGAEETMARLRASPEAMRAAAGLQAAGLQLRVGEVLLDAQVAVPEVAEMADGSQDATG